MDVEVEKDQNRYESILCQPYLGRIRAKKKNDYLLNC